MPSPISTPRLELVSFTPAFLRASLAGETATAATLLQATLPDGWPECRDLLELRLGQLQDDPALEPWLLRGMVLRDSRLLAGYIGFHTAPGPAYLEPYAPGGVEFGFTVFPAHRRQGYAREAAQALMQWAAERHCVTSFVMTIALQNAASQALAASLGFRRIGSHIDEIDGEEDILRLDL